MEIMQHSSAKEIESLDNNKKCCSICKTTQTPLWRSGPTGPKSVCNACGIKYRKRRSKEKPMKRDGRKKKQKWAEEGSKGKMGKAEGGKLVKVGLLAPPPLGKEVVPLQRRQRSPGRRGRKMGEVERAAAVLIMMALSCSCGCVVA